jgi:hypothetical protein
MTERYELNHPNVATETLDQEVMAIDFDNGLYFSLRGSAALIWTFVLAHHGVADIVQQLEVKLPDAARLVPLFIGQLEQKNLIRPSQAQAIAVDLSGFSNSLEAPELEVFDDMQAMLMLDPIHEVEPQRGWPFAKKV